MNIKLIRIKEIKNQVRVCGVFYCKNKELKKTKYGDPYISISLSDSSGRINAKIWKNVQHYGDCFEQGDIVAIKGSPNLYRKNVELNVLHIAKYSSERYDKYGFDPDSVVSKIVFDSDFLWTEISSFFDKAGDGSRLVKTIYNNHKEDIIKSPYHMDLDNQIEGSYLNHIYKTLKIFDLLDLFSYKDEDVDCSMVYSLIFLRNFHTIIGYEKNIVYTPIKEVLDRGEINVFHDYFNKYKKIVPKKFFSALEKSIFDSANSKLEDSIAGEIFRLVEYA